MPFDDQNPIASSALAGSPIRTTCPYCGVGCGVIASSNSDGKTQISGDPDHPANFGRLCSKGSALGETLSLDERLLFPMVHGCRASWNDALSLVAWRFSDAIREYGPDSVAFYVSGQILTEDYYVANKLMKGFIGSANIDTNSRLCMASSVAGHKRAFGTDTVPGCYEDLELADLVLLVGSNLAWCHPVLFQRLAAARERRGTQVVVIDPRATATCEIADLHLAITPGADVALFNGLLAHLAASGCLDWQYIASHTTGLDDALAAASASDVEEVAAATGLDGATLGRFFEMVAATHRTVTVYSQGVNQSSAGTDKVNAILNCHLASGRIGKPGMGPFSVTGQPNAMGGRETGGLANMLAAHMELGDAGHRRIVQTFWGSPRIAERSGLKAVDLFRAVGDGRIKALWIMGTNPVVSMPDADSVRRALEACPFVVVSDVERETDTTRHAHVLLPSAAWGEKSGTVTNSERRISRQRAFLPLPGEAKPDWWQLAEVGRRMGYGSAFGWPHPAEIFAEYARLTACENDGTRDLDLGALAGLDAAGYEALQPFQWPRPAGSSSGGDRLFGDGGFFTADRRARFVATPFRGPAQRPTRDFPMVLNTGRIRDQWHTMTRTGRAPRLMAHAPEPYVDVNPDDAAVIGLASASIAEIESSNGRMLARVVISGQQPAGNIFVPMHWTGTVASRSRVGSLTGSATDPISGQPELKHTPVVVRPFPARWFGFAALLAKPPLDVADYVAVARTTSGHRCELASASEPTTWDEALAAILGLRLPEMDVLAYHDAAAGQHRFAAFVNGRVIGVLFVSRRPLVGLARGWLVEQIGCQLAPEDRLRVLAGRAGVAAMDRGAIVCACLEVGRNEIIDAIVSGGASTIDGVASRTRAGTNCGSCRSDIQRILNEARLAKAG